MAHISTARQTTLSLRQKAGAKRGQRAACLQCGSMFTATHNRGQLYCGRGCSKRANWSNSTPLEREARTQKTANALKGRTTWNKGVPCKPLTRLLLSLGHKASGHRPKTRGGNGHVSPTEALVWEMLPATWVAQHPIKTLQPKGSGYPPAYKVDFANPQLKKVLEIDGGSHSSRKHLDAKRDALLTSLGWCVYRISNQEAQSLYTTFKSTGRRTILSKIR